MRLQRTAGNAAVARALAPRRTAQVPATRIADDVAGGLFVKEVAEGTPEKVARVLGETTQPERSALRLPKVSVNKSEAGWALAVSDVADTDDFESVSVAPGEVLRKSPVKVHVLPDHAQVDDDSFPPGSIDLTKGSGVGRGKMETIEDATVVCVVSEDAAGLIRANEQQHPDDFAQAFEVSAGAVRQAVTALSGQTFQSQADAVRAIISAGLDPLLVPEWPLVPEAWEQHIWNVLVKLYDVSKERDRRQEHSAKSRDGEINLTEKHLEMSPRMAAPAGLPSVSWVTLDRAKIAVAPPKFEDLKIEDFRPPWQADEGLVLRSDHESGLWDDALSREGVDTVLPRGTFGTFAGAVMRNARWLLRINLEGGALLIEPADAKLFEPGLRPAEVTEPAVEPTFVARLEVGGVTRIRRDVTERVRFYGIFGGDTQEESQGLDPETVVEKEKDKVKVVEKDRVKEEEIAVMEEGPGSAFENKDLIPIRQVTEDVPRWYVRARGDNGWIYALIPTKSLLGSD